MTLSISYILLFYLGCFIASLVATPFLFSLFKKSFDRGYSFSKLFTFLLLSYTAWLAGFLQIRITPLTTWLFFLLIAFFSSILFFRKKKEILDFFTHNRKLILLEESIFLCFFAFFLLIRFGNPDLWHPSMGGEKPMDLAFINAIVRSETMPPHDPWLGGETINYYYFGHYIVATLVKWLHIPSGYFYNIFLSFLFGQTALLAFSLLYSLTKKRVVGFLGILFLIGIGNLAQIRLIAQSFTTTLPINSWYWNATRIMPNFEINEFPYFSFLYADLHSHVISLPITIATIIVGLEIYRIKKIKTLIVLCLIAGALLGVIRMTNIWDYPTFTGLAGTIIFVKCLLIPERSKLEKFILGFFLTIFTVAISFVIAMPFLLTYRTGPLGLDLYTGPHTAIGDYILIHGLFLFLFISFFVTKFFLNPLSTIPRKKRLVLLIPLLALSITLLSKLYFLSLLSLLLVGIFYLFITPSRTREEKLVVFLMAVAILLTALPDLVDIKLGLGRMNTVFKFYFQAWILFALTSAYIFFSIFFHAKKIKIVLFIWVTIVILLSIASFTYVPTATYAKITDRMAPVNEITLNGEAYMKTAYYYDQGFAVPLSSDLRAIRWIRENITGPAVILETTTPIYRWGSRISIYTGLPTVVGWDWHEIAHRQYMAPTLIHERANDVRSIYESEDTPKTLLLLKKYNVSLIYIGQLEKIYYNTHGLENIISALPRHFKKVYSTPEASIYSFK